MVSFQSLKDRLSKKIDNFLKKKSVFELEGSSIKYLGERIVDNSFFAETQETKDELVKIACTIFKTNCTLNPSETRFALICPNEVEILEKEEAVLYLERNINIKEELICFDIAVNALLRNDHDLLSKGRPYTRRVVATLVHYELI